jgi:hypothetical protein
MSGSLYQVYTSNNCPLDYPYNLLIIYDYACNGKHKIHIQKIFLKYDKMNVQFQMNTNTTFGTPTHCLQNMDKISSYINA